MILGNELKLNLSLIPHFINYCQKIILFFFSEMPFLIYKFKQIKIIQQ